ncbi:MAG: redoxin domain-containing protein [Planctomycetes bacterium]|jgi:thiol-disulfide isomerase/thioredoxin|nr:redoxin domain-containing protein [Planctomycetota bacterium]
MATRCSLASVAVLALTASAFAQTLEVGAEAPPIAAAEWLNWQGEAPTLASCKGRVVMLEFWGTWCGPCVRAMPAIQKLHDRYRDRGLTVLAISYEPKATMEPFLKQNAYTMPVGSDPEKKTIAPYAIRSWPTTVIIDKDGKIAHIGSPYDAEAAVEKALGIEAGEGALLTAFFADQKATDKQKRRDAFDRLVEKATTSFDVASWARSQLPPESVPEGGAPTPVPVPASAPAKAAVRPADPLATLRKCGETWSDAAQRTQALRQLAEVTAPIDLAAFAQQAMAKAFPFDANELQALLKDKKYAAVLDAIGQRPPAAAVLSAAAKNADLAAFCKTKESDARAMARKGLMAQRWMFANALPRDEKLNRAFQGDLAASGMAMSDDRKSIIGLLLGGEMVHRDHVASYIRDHFARALLMSDLANGKPPRVKELPKLVEQATEDAVRELESKYGKPEPFVPKPEK